MDAFADRSISGVVMMSSSQVGKTEIVNNVIGYHVDQDPAPILLIEPTLDMAEAYSKDRLAPMIRDTPRLTGKVKDARSRDSGNTLLHKTYPGGHITIAGANSPASLASRPIRIVLCDETDRYPVSAGTEGDPIDLANKRARSFWNRVHAEFSTPTIEGRSRIQQSFEASDQRYFFVPCPDCGEFQTLQWQQVKFTETDPGSAVYECEHCKSHWDDGARWRAVRRGHWRASAAFTGVAGFHVWEAYAPGSELRGLVKNFLEVKDKPERLKTWVNTTLGQTWKESTEALDDKRLYDRRERYKLGTVPTGGLFLTAGVDVQADRLEVQVIAWGVNKESWLVDYSVLPGKTSQAEVWQNLTDFMSRTYTHESGVELHLGALAIDSGFETQSVYAWARNQGDRVLVIKGRTSGAAALGQPTAVDISYGGKKIRRGAKVWPVNVSILKDEFYGWLRLDSPGDSQAYPPGYCHFPELGEEFFKQLTAEQRQTRLVKGYRVSEYVKLRERNEALDTRIYARAAAGKMGMDRFREKDWAALKESLTRKIKSTPAPPAAPVAAVPAVETPKAPVKPKGKPTNRQNVPSNWMNN